MAETNMEASPTGAFGEGASERPAEHAPAPSYKRDTAQHVSRSPQSETDDAEGGGTSVHAPMIKR